MRPSSLFPAIKNRKYKNKYKYVTWQSVIFIIGIILRQVTDGWLTGASAAMKIYSAMDIIIELEGRCKTRQFDERSDSHDTAELVMKFIFFFRFENTTQDTHFDLLYHYTMCDEGFTYV
jgi:hypothetical protein